MNCEDKRRETGEKRNLKEDQFLGQAPANDHLCKNFWIKSNHIHKKRKLKQNIYTGRLVGFEIIRDPQKEV